MDTRDREIFPENASNPEVSYDRTDISISGIVKFLVALAVVGVIIHFGLWGVYQYLAKGEVQPSAQPNPMVTSNRQLKDVGGDPSQVFPAPRLQPDPVADMNKFRAKELEILNSYGWVDEKAGVARIPIDRAMQMVVQQGLPTRPEASQPMQPQTSAGAKSETGSGSGPSGNQPQVKR